MDKKMKGHPCPTICTPFPPHLKVAGISRKNIKSALSFILSDFRGTPLYLNSEMKGGRGSPFMKYPFVFLSIYSPRFRVVSQAIAQTKFQYGGGCATLRSTMLALSSAVVCQCAWPSPVPGRCWVCSGRQIGEKPRPEHGAWSQPTRQLEDNYKTIYKTIQNIVQNGHLAIDALKKKNRLFSFLLPQAANCPFCVMF